MITLRIVSWKKGLLAVSLVNLLMKYPKSLAQAKADVERLLGGGIIILYFENETQKENFQRKVEELGGECD